MAWKGWESPKHGAPVAVLGGGPSAASARVSAGLWNIKPLQKRFHVRLHARQSFFINPLARRERRCPHKCSFMFAYSLNVIAQNQE